MNNDTQDIDLNNEETTTGSEVGETTEQKDEVDWEAKAREMEGRLKRAETKLKKSTETSSPSKPSTSDNFDYSQKAFLAVHEIRSGKELELAKSFVQNTGKSIDDVVTNKYFLQEFKELKDLERTSEAVPSGSKRAGQTATDTVEYWLAKGEMPPRDQPKLRQDYVNAKMSKDANSKKFYND